MASGNPAPSKPSYKELQEKAKKLGVPVVVGVPYAALEKEIQRFERAELLKGSTSAKIRLLSDQGLPIKDIAKQLNVNYAFAYGVVQRHQGKVHTKQPRETISDRIRQLYDQGKTRAEIRKELGLDYSFVHTVVKQYEARKERDDDGPGSEFHYPPDEDGVPSPEGSEGSRS